MEVKYLDDPAKWPVLAEKLAKAGEFGYDSETYGQEDRESPQHRARVHCWSVGWLTEKQSGRGYRSAVGVVLPYCAFDSPEIRAIFSNPLITKWAHNAPHDWHAAANMGIEINGLQDSLQWFRVAFPGMQGYGLKAIAKWALGYKDRPSFIEMMTHKGIETKVTRKREKGCICGNKPCHQRSNKEFLSNDGVYKLHRRVEWSRFTCVSKVVDVRYKVTDFTKDAILDPLIWNNSEYSRWEQWLEYAVEDAIQCIEAIDWLRNKSKPKIEYPWH
jgi:hypothetical protein